MTDFTEINLIEIIEKIKAGDRRSLSRAITLAESTRKDHQRYSKKIIQQLISHPKKSVKIGLTGTPGVGKSTFIETLGLQLIQKGKKVAVLAIDPSSSKTGGSILGDKTRMELLSKEPNAFIRPSPNRGSLGGVAKRTREVITLCEAAGYDIILVETVGVGQSETMVSEMTDVFCLLIAPAGGDELQGVKRGIMEMSDVILINKADGELKAIARQTSAQYEGALRLFRHRKCDPPNFPKVICVSSLRSSGLTEAWITIEKLVSWRQKNGHFKTIRENQKIASFKRELFNEFENKITKSHDILSEIKALEERIGENEITPELAAAYLIKKIFI